MKAMIAMLRLVAALFVFVGILAGCVAALFLIIVLLRFPLLLIAILLTCWIVSGLRNSPDKPSP